MDDKPAIELAECVEAGTKSGGHLLVDADGQVQRLPVPSKDPNDPLNYSTWEKTAIIVSCCWFSTMSLSCIGGLGAILNVFFQLYLPQGYTTNQVVWLSTFPSLFVGIGNFLILPLGLLYGRRIATIISTVVLLGATIGCAVSNTWEQHLALRIIQGLAAGATESLIMRHHQVLPLILAEVTFVHQHGMVYGLYWATQNAMTGCLTLAASYEVASLGWRWFYWVFAIAVAIGLILVVFGGFETAYKRNAQFVNGRMVTTDRFGVTRMLTEDETREVLESQGHPSRGEEIPEELRPKKTYWQKLKPWSHPTESALTFIPQILFQIVEALMCPGILYATLLSSVVLGSSIGMSLSYNTVLEYNYHWAAESIGLINLGGVFGGFGGMLYAGFLGDKFIVWKARRNGGAFAPEHRLILLIFPGVVAVAALLLYGFTADGGATWGGPYMGWTLFQIAFVSVLILSTSFAAETWERNPGPALAAVVGMKNIVAFALSYGINPMVEKYSYPTAMGILAAVTGGVFLLGIPVYILNPKVRTNVRIKYTF
ncbi:major facilitator superfamily domain-containing protein [Aspergillus parasiticus]|uniref:Major facilitator superfamily domain-containing protein n=1 Tax=Aspergillus parasiticus TaxID=5067 RepID=A0A5N6DKR5_ASPPA|nr:major facilitator superfamily domain-containing protein [Aspergillus parasiticus]